MRHAVLVVLALLAAGCVSPATDPADYQSVTPATVQVLPSTPVDSEQASKGRYLVQILGCGTCHTDGALVGEVRDDRLLAGSSVGIAYSDPLVYDKPGVVFPSNLTPDVRTGIGALSEKALIALIRSGSSIHDGSKLMVMPWPAYEVLTDEDATAIAAYLRSLPPLSHDVPGRVRAGETTRHQYVYFGVYRSRR